MLAHWRSGQSKLRACFEDYSLIGLQFHIARDHNCYNCINAKSIGTFLLVSLIPSNNALQKTFFTGNSENVISHGNIA